MIREFSSWLFFSVVLSLLHLAFAPFVYRFARNWPSFAQLVKDGSLFIFATTLSATSFGDFFRNRATVAPLWSDMAFYGGILLPVFTAGLYCVVLCSAILQQVQLEQQEGVSAPSVKLNLDDQIICRVSLASAIGAAIYSAAIFVFVHIQPQVPKAS